MTMRTVSIPISVRAAPSGGRAPSHIGSREVSTRFAVAFLWLFGCKDGEATWASAVAIHAGNRKKFVCIEACPADERPIDVFHAEQVARITWLDRAAIDDARVAGAFGKTR